MSYLYRGTGCALRNAFQIRRKRRDAHECCYLSLGLY